VKRALLLVCLFALCNLTLLAQTGKVPRAAHTTEKSKIHVAPQEAPAGSQKIFSNLGPNRFNLYNDTFGWPVTGPNTVEDAPLTGQESVGMPFTPNSNAQVSQVRLALQYISGGEVFYVSIYGDSGGRPGTLLAGPVTLTHLPLFGTCCTLAVAHFDPPLPVTGETQYWVVASTPTTGKGSDSSGFWDWVYQDDIPPVFLPGVFGLIEDPGDFGFFNFEQPGDAAAAFEVLD
jgi:hypothetical protein